MSQVLLPRFEDKMIAMIEEGTTFSSLKRRAFRHLLLRPYDIYIVTHRGIIDRVENSPRGMAQIALFYASWNIMILLSIVGSCMTMLGMFGDMPIVRSSGMIACLLAMLYASPVVFGFKSLSR